MPQIKILYKDFNTIKFELLNTDLLRQGIPEEEPGREYKSFRKGHSQKKTINNEVDRLSIVFAALLDRGTYPIFLANDTTFSLSVALSIKVSLTTILVLYAVVYELYASRFTITDRLEPSKSISVNLEFSLRYALIEVFISSKFRFVNC